MFQAPMAPGADHQNTPPSPHPPSHHAGVVPSSAGVRWGPCGLGRRVRALPTAPVLRVQRRLLGPGVGGAVVDDDLGVQALRMRLGVGVTHVVGVSGGAQLGRVSVHPRPLLAVVLGDDRRRETAGFHHRRHVDGGGGVGPQDDAVLVHELRPLGRRRRLVIGRQSQPEVALVTRAMGVSVRALSDAGRLLAEVDAGSETIDLLDHLNNNKESQCCVQTAG